MKKLIIYFSEDHTCFQVITPSEKFNGDWRGLAYSIGGCNYYSYVVIS